MEIKVIGYKYITDLKTPDAIMDTYLLDVDDTLYDLLFGEFVTHILFIENKSIGIDEYSAFHSIEGSDYYIVLGSDKCLDIFQNRKYYDFLLDFNKHYRNKRLEDILNEL